MKPVIMESPLRGDFKRNLRYALWCARYLTVVESYAVYASHLICPLFMDDRNTDEREQGIQCALVIGNLMTKRIFCIDLGWSEGMSRAKAYAVERDQPYDTFRLDLASPSWWQRFVEGEMPPRTPGFALSALMAADTTDQLTKGASAVLDGEVGRQAPKYILRFFDMFDGWMDISGPMSKEKADKMWKEKTENGTKNTKYDDGDYYKVFPADTQMLMTPEFLGR